MRSFKLPICALLLVAAGACNRTTNRPRPKRKSRAAEYRLRHQCRRLRTETGEVGSGETLGKNPKRVRRFGPYGRQARQSLERDFPAAQHPRRA